MFKKKKFQEKTDIFIVEIMMMNPRISSEYQQIK